MFKLKFVRFFSFDEPITPDQFVALTENKIKTIPEGSRSTFGFSDTEPVSQLESPKRRPYVIGQFEGAQRSVPKALIERYVDSERKKLLQEGQVATKDTLAEFRMQAEEVLSAKLDPELLESNVIFLPRDNLLLLTCQKRALMDDLATGLHHEMKIQNAHIRPYQQAVSKSRLKLLAQHYQQVGVTLNEVVMKSGGIVRVQPESTEQQYYRDMLQHADVDRITFSRDDLLNVTVTEKGTIHDAIPGDTFSDRWREVGCGEESTYLDFVRAGIWIDELMDILEIVTSKAAEFVEAPPGTATINNNPFITPSPIAVPVPAQHIVH